MKNATHNSGPLVVREGEWKTPTYSDEKCTIPTGTMTEKVQMVCVEDYGALAYCFNWHGNAKANATLYAAAPELLESLYELTQWEGIQGGFEASCWRRAHAAIAKATGQEGGAG